MDRAPKDELVRRIEQLRGQARALEARLEDGAPGDARALDPAPAPVAPAAQGPARPASLAERYTQLQRHTAVLEQELASVRTQLEEVSESEKRYRILSQLTNDYCFMAKVQDGELLCDWITGSLAATTGYGSGELLLQGVHGIVHADDREKVRAAVQQVAQGEPAQHEYRILTRSAELRWVREQLRPEVWVGGEVHSVYGAVRDVTERHVAREEHEALEAQLRQSQKMDAVGRLAGGIAHDFNNLLTVITTHTGFLLERLEEGSQSHDDAADVQQAARRAARLTQRLLTFSRQQVVTPTTLELNRVIRDLEPMLNSLLGEGAELDVELQPEQSPIRMDRSQVEQILLNLVVNARDAMAPTGGRVIVATGEVDLGEAFVRSHPDSSPGRHVALAVRDNGSGMEPGVLARVFEPFFTTKPPEKGTGLGLSTVYGIVRQAGGSIDVQSEQGFGTTFEIYFPVAKEVLAAAPSARPAEVQRTASETILVVEDEEGVRRGVQRILKHAGYEVLVAADPAQAITIAEEFPERIDMLLTDVVMPMMNGVELAERVVALREGIRVLYMSGYTSDTVDTETPLDGDIAFLHKPFTRQGMLAKVAEVLSSDAGQNDEADGAGELSSA